MTFVVHHLAAMLPAETWHLDSVLERWVVGGGELTSPQIVIIYFHGWVLFVVHVVSFGWCWFIFVFGKSQWWGSHGLSLALAVVGSIVGGGMTWHCHIVVVVVGVWSGWGWLNNGCCLPPAVWLLLLLWKKERGQSHGSPGCPSFIIIQLFLIATQTVMMTCVVTIWTTWHVCWHARLLLSLWGCAVVVGGGWTMVTGGSGGWWWWWCSRGGTTQSWRHGTSEEREGAK